MEPTEQQKPTSNTNTEFSANTLDLEFNTENYQARVEDMSGMLKRLTASGDLDALGKVWDEYVGAESNPTWKQFCGVMLGSPQFANDDHTLSEIKSSREQHVQLSRENIEYEKEVKLRKIAFNHFLRDMLEAQRDKFTMAQVGGWLSTFTENRKLSDGSVAGAMAEIAVREAAFEMSGALRVVEYGDVEDDSHGADVKARTSDDLSSVSIDVKAGKQLPVGKATHKDIHLVIGVPETLFDSHGRVDEVGRQGLKNAISYSLNQGGYSLAKQQIA